MIELSVILPMFRAKYIAWLALESLARQRSVDFEWELIIAEEANDETLGYDEIMKYKERLESCGCVRVRYTGLNKWIPLGKKIALCLDYCDLDSEVYVPTPADYYSAPLRLATTYKAFQENEIDWFKTSRTIYYDIVSGITALHDISGTNRYDCADMARSLEFRKYLAGDGPVRGVDGWFYANYVRIAREVFKRELRVFADTSDNWKYAMNTDGLNSISTDRVERMKDGRSCFCSCPVDVRKTIPSDILSRLEDCRKHVGAHKRGLG